MTNDQIDALITRLQKIERIGPGWGLPILDGESLDVTCKDAVAALREMRAINLAMATELLDLRGSFPSEKHEPLYAAIAASKEQR